MDQEVVIKVRSLKKYFDVRRGFFSTGNLYVKALDGVDFEIRKGEILGLVGESGCGKTTTGRLLTRLEDPTEGNVFFLGRDIAPLKGDDLKTFRRNIQMVFQDPYESLNPRTTVLQTVLEPLVNHNIGRTLEERISLVIKALEDAGLAPAKEYLERFPHELSGGQRQRVSIARALVMSPRVIVADEPVSMLDVSIRAGVLNLMLDLREKYHIPYLFITHDIAVARYVSDTLAVMYLGKIVEIAGTDKVIFTPKHPYTQALLSAVPVPDPEHRHGRIRIAGEIPSAIDIPLGCRFRPRCPARFESCGWEAKDLIDYLTDEEHAMNPGNPLERHIASLDPYGFALVVRIKEGGNPGAVLDYVRSTTERLRDTNPMFKAIVATDTMRADLAVEVSTSHVDTPEEVIAEELLQTLKEEVDFMSPSHPVHGTITNATRQGSRVVISSGEGKADQAAKFMEDFVDRGRRTKHPEFRGVSSIQPDEGQNHVDIQIRQGLMTKPKVTSELAKMVERDFDLNEKSEFHNIITSITEGSSGLTIRVMGPKSRFDELAKALRNHFAQQAESGSIPARGVRRIQVVSKRNAGTAVAVRFKKIGIPPLFDVGPGHTAACYLYGSPEA